MLQVFFKYLVILWICSCLTVMHQNMDWKLHVSTGGFFCRVTRWAPGLLVGGTHISIFAGLFSRALFLSLETFLLVSCLGKRNIHEAATSLCCALMQFQKRRPLWVDDLVKDVPLWAEATQWALGLTGRWYLLPIVSGGCNPELG